MTKSKQGVWLKPIAGSQGGRDYWIADLRCVGGTRKFWDRTPAGKASCQKFCDEVMERERRFGEAAHDLTTEQFVDAVKAFALIRDRGKGVTLERIVSEWCGENNHDVIEISMENAIEGYRRNMLERNLRPATIKSGIERASRLGRHVGMDTTAGTLKTDVVERFFKAKRIVGNNARTYWTELKVFMDWLVKERYLRKNPILGIPKPEKVYKDVQILNPPSDLAKILKSAEEIDPNLIIPISIRFFAGMRPAEIERMSADDINLETGFIKVGSTNSKVKRERYVRIEPNLRSILESWDPWDFSWTNYRWSKVCENANLHIRSDIARKSYISYHLEKFKDKNLTTMYAGNSEMVADMHYIKVVTEAQAEAYWRITV